MENPPNQRNSMPVVREIFGLIFPAVDLQKTVYAIASTRETHIAYALFDLVEGSWIRACLNLGVPTTAELDQQQVTITVARWAELMALKDYDMVIARKLGVYPQLSVLVLCNQARALARRLLGGVVAGNPLRDAKLVEAAMASAGLVSTCALSMALDPRVTPDAALSAMTRSMIIRETEKGRPKMKGLGDLSQFAYGDLLDQVPGDLATLS